VLTHDDGLGLDRHPVPGRIGGRQMTAERGAPGARCRTPVRRVLVLSHEERHVMVVPPAATLAPTQSQRTACLMRS
jgi:hypothetical protein